MTTRPTDLPDWATAASAAVVEPSASKQAAGFEEFDTPPHNWVNWFWRRCVEWIAHFSTSSSKFLTLEAAINATAASGPMVAGDTFILNENDNAGSPGTSTDEEILGAGRFPVGTIAVTGKSVVAYVDGAGGGLRATSRADGTVIQTYTLTNALGTGVVAVDSDGVYVAIAYGQYVELFDHDTGASLWDYDNTDTVNDVAIGTDLVFLVGSDASSLACKAISIALGTATWSYDHGGAQLFTVCYAGRQLLVGGAASTSASLAKFRSIESATGKDVAGEGGIGTSTETFVYDKAFGVFDGPQQIATDGRIWAMKYSNTDLRTGGLADGVASTASPTSTEPIKQIAMDHELIYVTTDDGLNVGRVWAVNKHDILQRVWQFQNAETDKGMHSIASDGASVYAARFLGGGGTGRCYKIRRGNTPGVWRITDPETSEFIPLRQLATPVQGT